MNERRAWATLAPGALGMLLLGAKAAAQPVEGPPEAPAAGAPAESALAEEALAEVPVAADPAAAGDDLDLGMLDLDPSGPMFDDSLQIYGFADFTWQRRWATSEYIPSAREFGVGNVNLYLRKNLTPKWRALAEVRLMFTPNGSIGYDGQLIDTSAGDPANAERPMAWGGLSIERVYLEYDVAPWLSVRAGRWLTPYGIWNIDHGSPAIIGAARPYIVGEQFFPERQTGVELFGSRAMGEASVEYQLTFSNGRSSAEAVRDPDRQPAGGGRLAVELPLAGTLRAGVSGYAGRASEAVIDALTGAPTSRLAEYDELALGADASWDHGGLRLQVELLSQQRRYVEGKRAVRQGGGFAPDSLAWGMYGLAGYRFQALWNVMPYVLVERYHAIDPTRFGSVLDFNGGLNLRPTAAVVLKAELTYGRFGDGGLFDDSSIHLLRLQTAWVF